MEKRVFAILGFCISEWFNNDAVVFEFAELDFHPRGHQVRLRALMESCTFLFACWRYFAYVHWSFFNLDSVPSLKADPEAKWHRWRAFDRVKNAAGFVEVQVNQWLLTLLVALVAGPTCQNVRMKEPRSWTPSCIGDNTVGIKKVNIWVDVQTVSTLQHLLPSLIPHAACCPLPYCSFNCPWSSLMLYFLYAWPVVLLALLFPLSVMPFAWCRLSLKCLLCPRVACVCPCSLTPNPVFLMPSALYGFLFLSDCTHGSYRDGSHAMRWKHSALDQGSSHLTHKCLHTSTHIREMHAHTCLLLHAHILGATRV